MITKKIILTITVIGLAAIFATTVFAQNGAHVGAKSTINNVCVQAAVDIREQAMGDAWTTFSSSVASALSARKTALHGAWGLADGSARRTARAAAWEAFNNANKSAHSALKAVRKNIWSVFKNSSNACGVLVVEAPARDTTGGIGL